MPIERRLRAILQQRCPVCLEGPMFSGVFAMYDRCPRCEHQFEREPGFFQGAMYVSWVLGVALFSLLALFADFVLAPRMGLPAALALAVFIYMAGVPVLFRYSRVIWSHVNVGTLDRE